jgi:hypothetical protein
MERKRLPKGWTLEIVKGDDREQGFVFAPGDRDSASLAYALACGATSGENETAIPSDVMKALEAYREYE